ncbi:hypothetical protein ACFVGM_08745 [Kitasatospora purpeofusca]|uniref:hypothetical protein n=1 Tax=Kitasatospora purpeofusca TaxID=67352 RepID=UPI003683778D
MPEAPRTIGRRRDLPVPAAPEAPTPISGVVVRHGDQETQRSTGGWGEYDRVIESASTLANYLKIGTKPFIIKVIDAEPFDSFVCHWIDEITNGSKSVRCWRTPECPLCRIGDKPNKFSACFNVISLEDPGNPALKIWEAGVRVARTLKGIGQDERRGPLDRPDLYFSVSKTETAGKSTEYVLERVKDRDLEDEYRISPLTVAQLAAFAADRVTEPIKAIYTEAAMNEVVDLLMAD